jgi:large subunit ribosomal protein L25
LHFVNQDSAVGVKQQGGEVSIIANEVEVSTLPANLPEFIEVDLAQVEVGQVVHLSDIQLPEGVSLIGVEKGSSNDHAIANIHAAATGAADDEADAE